MKIIIANVKPRNPLVALAKFRNAGQHKTGKVRQQQRRELQRKLKELE
jgi:hypothetical protein